MWGDMKRTVAFRNFANDPKSGKSSQYKQTIRFALRGLVR